MTNGTHWIETLGADPAAIADAAAAEHAEGIVQIRQALGRCRIPTVDDEAPGLQQPGRADIFLRVPPPGRTLRGTAAAEDAFVQAIEPGTLCGRLQALDARCWLIVDQPGLDTFVLLEEQALAHNQVAYHRHAGQWPDDRRPASSRASETAVMQARRFLPPMFMPSEPQTPSRQE